MNTLKFKLAKTLSVIAFSALLFSCQKNNVIAPSGKANVISGAESSDQSVVRSMDAAGDREEGGAEQLSERG